MKKTDIQDKGYNSPSCSCFEIVTEGMLCSSNPLTISDWEENDDVL
ncbi:MAG: hypothetical protein IJ005_00915 [Bacteroidales bacterium]|nr:hypothetical protein [Bacteroidales bacterium]